MLLFIGVSLRMRGFNATQAALQRRLAADSLSSSRSGKAGDAVQQTCRMVRAASHYGVRRGTCLEQSLTLWYLLRKQGISAKLRIGVRKSAEKFEAHAWVEHEGMAVNDSHEVHQHYAAFSGEISGAPGENS